eukprot:CAMPEP_0119550212 /NCGR_PEP_ID=MMETSP1352-20130426/3772_1 /TAXON_ID=265584 /ORGANISM="Stauroneis constricta, Strain CCMP1120" /LENGTH=69 /DNA_ID=CAMNT_0007595985 /DNA_START=69 /DNA_END=274 /DNA_ORIENTATION=+
MMILDADSRSQRLPSSSTRTQNATSSPKNTTPIRALDDVSSVGASQEELAIVGTSNNAGGQQNDCALTS